MKPVIAIHGGAGTITRAALNADQEQDYLDALDYVLLGGQSILEKGGSALDAVTEAVLRLEDCPLFNAGKGAVFTHAGTHELDASIMDGRTLAAGAVACVKSLRNPIRAARAVMENGRHVLLVGEGAEAFARQAELETVPSDYYFTVARHDQWLRALADGASNLLDHDAQSRMTETAPIDPDTKMGTVGAVALDAQGNLAAATSTGGVTDKRVGRVGDSPLIGAGCYANNRTAAVSCTGSGEMFIRMLAAYDVSAMMEYRGLSLDEACRAVVMDKLPTIEGRGGLIAVDAQGNVRLTFNTEGMYRGHAYAGGPRQTAIYR
ncbi:isoaspartyl peptidase/L-asparaginase family protein [Propionivibrio soli]|uniref:isoaspartyl peptidase/L-asparaginase family protein n=1 Tax=Propionivibrio soli TaxID=2976531 RepID=UPI0021E70EDC|nr:isoaspartyl peptidase/L-asparaginase [Propionivibrio soli]